MPFWTFLTCGLGRGKKSSGPAKQENIVLVPTSTAPETKASVAEPKFSVPDSGPDASNTGHRDSGPGASTSTSTATQKLPTSTLNEPIVRATPSPQTQARAAVSKLQASKKYKPPGSTFYTQSGVLTSMDDYLTSVNNMNMATITANSNSSYYGGECGGSGGGGGGNDDGGGGGGGGGGDSGNDGNSQGSW